ncbi:PDDEXK nuclease domain-containing protein [Legionella gratiana]|nr:PDDEXK nuclease domain-containing protein [Legionella gratiana]
MPLTFDDQEFFVDLLFYHLELRAFLVIELKNTKAGAYRTIGFLPCSR